MEFEILDWLKVWHKLESNLILIEIELKWKTKLALKWNLNEIEIEIIEWNEN